jgi:hypothetical protein
MNIAGKNEAVLVGHLLNINKETVWEIIRGMQYTTYAELAMAVHEAFALISPHPPDLINAVLPGILVKS